MASLVPGQPLRVLLISLSAAQRDEVGRALEGAGDHRYYWVAQPDLALVRGQGLSPHVILIDCALGGDSAAELVRSLVAGVPGAELVALVEPDAPEAARDMVLAGAVAMVVKPVQPGDLLEALRRALRQSETAASLAESAPATGRVVVFCAPKGGTGRTTLAINTAVALREMTREPVVLVDADYAAPAIDVALNLRRHGDISDLLPRLSVLDADLVSSVLATHESGVRALLAPSPEQMAARPTQPQVQQVTVWLKRMFSWVLVDLGLPLDEVAYALLDGAERIVISVLPEMVGLRNAKLLLRQLGMRNYPPDRVWSLLNRAGMKGGVARAAVETYLGTQLRFTVPNDQDLSTETLNRGVPLVTSHRRRPLAQAYRGFAQQLILDRAGKTGQLAAASSPVGTILPVAAPAFDAGSPVRAAKVESRPKPIASGGARSPRARPQRSPGSLPARTTPPTIGDQAQRRLRTLVTVVVVAVIIASLLLLVALLRGMIPR